MRRIIGGLVYDTETAELIHRASRKTFLESWEGALYRTKNERWFIAEKTENAIGEQEITENIRSIECPKDVIKWLEEMGAEEEAFTKAGVTLEDA